MPNKNQAKALTLFVLDALEGTAGFDVLMSALFHTGYADLADLADVFEELATGNLITIHTNDSGKHCTISERGRMILPELSDVFAPGVRKDAMQQVLRAYEEFTAGKAYSSEIQQNDKGIFLICYAKSKALILDQVCLNFETMEQAVQAAHHFEKRPQAVFNGIRALITGNADLIL